MSFEVVVVEHETERTVKRYKPLKTEREAERLERGVLRNLDDRFYYTEVREVS